MNNKAIEFLRKIVDGIVDTVNRGYVLVNCDPEIVRNWAVQALAALKADVCQPEDEFVKDLPFPLKKCFAKGAFNGIARVTLGNGDYAVHPKALKQLETEFIKALTCLTEQQEKSKLFKQSLDCRCSCFFVGHKVSKESQTNICSYHEEQIAQLEAEKKDMGASYERQGKEMRASLRRWCIVNGIKLNDEAEDILLDN